MDLTSPKTIKSLLKDHHLWAKKRLGQHFLICKNVLDKITNSAQLSKKDLVLEIGPGIGVLTKELCPRAKKVIACELDKKMVEILRETCGQFKNLKIINEDILKVNLAQSPELQAQSYKIVANLPYQITSPVLWKFLHYEKKKPQEMILMVQKEVAARICTNPPDMNLLSVMVQFYGKPKIITEVGKNCFWPCPEVTSAVIKISDIKDEQSEVADEKLFFRIVKAGFSQKRKQLKNSLAAGLNLDIKENLKILEEIGINPQRRAETLNLEDWKKLYFCLRKFKIRKGR